MHDGKRIDRASSAGAGRWGCGSASGRRRAERSGRDGRAFAADAPVGTWPAGVSRRFGIRRRDLARSPAPIPPTARTTRSAMNLPSPRSTRATPHARAWGLKGKGVLGKEVRYAIADSQLNAERRRAGADRVHPARQRHHDHRLRVLGDGGGDGAAGPARARCSTWSAPRAPTRPPARIASATASAPSRRPTWRARRSARWLAASFGRGRKAAYLVPDYNYGHSVFDSFSEVDAPVRLDRGDAAGGAAVGHRLQLGPAQHRQLRRRRLRQRRVRRLGGELHQAGRSSSASCRR